MLQRAALKVRITEYDNLTKRASYCPVLLCMTKYIVQSLKVVFEESTKARLGNISITVYIDGLLDGLKERHTVRPLHSKYRRRYSIADYHYLHHIIQPRKRFWLCSCDNVFERTLCCWWGFKGEKQDLYIFLGVAKCMVHKIIGYWIWACLSYTRVKVRLYVLFLNVGLDRALCWYIMVKNSPTFVSRVHKNSKKRKTRIMLKPQCHSQPSGAAQPTQGQHYNED